MAYDVELADRVRTVLYDEKRLRELKMFGGQAFMVNDKMLACVGAGGAALLVRVDGDRDAEYLKVDGARPADMGDDRSMGQGWIAIEDTALATDEELRFWIDAGLEYNTMVTGGPYGKASS